MTFPAFLFGSLIAILQGSLFHVIVGGNLSRYLSYLFFAWLGFWIGHYLSPRLPINLWNLGMFDLGICILGGLIVLLLIYWIDRNSYAEEEEEQNG